MVDAKLASGLRHRHCYLDRGAWRRLCRPTFTLPSETESWYAAHASLATVTPATRSGGAAVLVVHPPGAPFGQMSAEGSQIGEGIGSTREGVGPNSRTTPAYRARRKPRYSISMARWKQSADPFRDPRTRTILVAQMARHFCDLLRVRGRTSATSAGPVGLVLMTISIPRGAPRLGIAQASRASCVGGGGLRKSTRPLARTSSSSPARTVTGNW